MPCRAGNVIARSPTGGDQKPERYGSAALSIVQLARIKSSADSHRGKHRPDN
jgi:hypothetical protein